MPLPLKPFYMIRHGQTEANAARIMAGHTDSPLTELGRQQAFEAQKVVAALPVKPAAIFHSHLSRARDTAAIINQALDVEMFEDPDLAEIHAGDWEGVSWDECLHLIDEWAQGPNGEHPNDFFERIKRGKSAAIRRFNDPILIVCHGGVMRGFGELYGIRAPGLFENAHLYEFNPVIMDGEVPPIFPWAVYDYRLCQKTRTLIKTESEIYIGEDISIKTLKA